MVDLQYTIKTIILEDDVQAREALGTMVTSMGNFSISGMAGSIGEGLRLLQEHDPDVAFLDVELADGSIFDLLDQVRDREEMPHLVFTTAYDKYAIQAFRHAAFDFLLKPLSESDVELCIRRLQKSLNTHNFQLRIETLLNQIRPPGKIRFNTRTGFTLIDPEEIMYIQADSNYCEVYLSKEDKELVTTNIGKIEDLLPKGRFFRINRSQVINLQYLSKVNTLSLSCTLVKGQDSVQLKASMNQIVGLKRIT